MRTKTETINSILHFKKRRKGKEMPEHTILNVLPGWVSYHGVKWGLGRMVNRPPI